MRKWYKFHIKKDHDKVVASLNSLLEAVSTHISYDLSKDDFLKSIQESPLVKEIGSVFDKEIGEAQNIISIGCSNAEHEIAFLKKNPHLKLKWDFTDFDPRSLDFLTKNFHEYNNLQVDILQPQFKEHYSNLAGKYDVVFVPGILYLFDDERANLLFKNLGLLLKDSHSKIIFCFREREHFFTRIIDTILAPIDSFIVYFLKKTVKHENVSIRRSLHGFRRTDLEFKRLISQSRLMSMICYESCYDLEYSSRLNFFKKIGINKLIGKIVGKSIPYLNIHVLKKNNV